MCSLPQLVTLVASCLMVGGALWLYHAPLPTLQHLWTEFQAIIVGGLLGLYLFGPDEPHAPDANRDGLSYL